MDIEKVEDGRLGIDDLPHSNRVCLSHSGDVNSSCDPFFRFE